MTSYFELEQRFHQRLRELEAQGLRSQLRRPSWIDLSSNDYLGLAAHPFVKQKMAQAAISLGCGSTASRLLRGDRVCFAELEGRFADFKKTKSALYFSSGYAANLSVLSTFLDRTDL